MEHGAPRSRVERAVSEWQIQQRAGDRADPRVRRLERRPVHVDGHEPPTLPEEGSDEIPVPPAKVYDAATRAGEAQGQLRQLPPKRRVRLVVDEPRHRHRAPNGTRIN